MVEWITSTMNGMGYWGIALLMFLENLFPPIPSELIMPFAGFTVAKGKMDFTLAVLAGIVGTVLGAFPWYYVGLLLGEERLRQQTDRYGRWIGVSGEDIAKSKHWFDRHGFKAVFLCRMVPGVRTLISIPAGIGAMPILPFVIFSTIGTALWVGFLTYAGFFLGERYTLIEDYLGPVSKWVLGGLLLVFGGWLGWKIWTKDKGDKS